MKPLISIVVPAHNEEGYISETLRALRLQRYPYFEIIVVTNGCTDNTAQVARAYAHRLIDIPERGLSKARNVGAAKARGDLLVFLDADTHLAPDAIGTIANEFTPLNASGTLRARPDKSHVLFQLLYFLKNLLHRTGLHRGSSGVILCWRDSFKEIGGFDESLHLRENSDLICRLQRFGNYRFIRDTVAVTSMRRYEKRGGKAVWNWLKIWFRSLVTDVRGKKYEVVR